MPYAPGITYQTGAIGQAIGQLGQNLWGAVDQYRREKQEGQFLDTQFESLAQAVAAANPDRAPELAKFGGLSLAQKRGKLAGLAFEVDQMRRQQDQKLRERQLAAAEGQLRLSESIAKDNMAARGRAEQERTAERDAARAFSAELGMLSQGGPLAEGLRQPGNLSLADVVGAAGRTGHSLPAGTLMEAVRTTQRREAAAPRTVQVAGRDAVFSPETGAFQMLPTDELTPAQRSSAIAQISTEYGRLISILADPKSVLARGDIEAVLDMYDEQLNEFGVKPPRRNRANAGKEPTDGSTTRWVSDKDGNIRDRR